MLALYKEVRFPIRHF